MAMCDVDLFSFDSYDAAADSFDWNLLPDDLLTPSSAEECAPVMETLPTLEDQRPAPSPTILTTPARKMFEERVESEERREYDKSYTISIACNLLQPSTYVPFPTAFDMNYTKNIFQLTNMIARCGLRHDTMWDAVPHWFRIFVRVFGAPLKPYRFRDFQIVKESTLREAYGFHPAAHIPLFMECPTSGKLYLRNDMHPSLTSRTRYRWCVKILRMDYPIA